MGLKVLEVSSYKTELFWLKALKINTDKTELLEHKLVNPYGV
jgi:hypothetical protein